MIFNIYKVVAAYVIVPIISATGLFFFFGADSSEIECFVREYQGILTSLGTLVLVSVLAIFAAQLASHSSEMTAKNNRRIQAELRLAEFRHIWISEMRDDISELLSLSFHPTSKSDIAKAYQLSMKIEMRLNPSEALAASLSESLVRISKADGLDAEHNAALSELVETSRKYLKAEWARLKRDIEAAQLIEANPQ